MVKKTDSLNPENFNTMGKLLRYLRERAHLTQRELAAKVDFHYSYISRVEKDQHSPDLATITARFIPALDLENESAWSKHLIRLANLASAEKTKPIRSALSASDEKTNKMPANLVPLLGREMETSQLMDIFQKDGVRILTIVGPPGVGKTTLALHVAEKLHQHFANGAIFVNLAPVEQPNMVLTLLAEALGVEETSNPSSMLVLQSYLEKKKLLIVMDNFEQVLSAASELFDIITYARGIKIIITSREALRIPGEQEFHLTPLSLPDNKTTNLAELGSSPAIQLFIQRARAVQADFKLTEENAARVTEICHRLDGLPLAIELAAARIQTLSLTSMLEQFDRRFDWLTRGRRDTPLWRQTLSGAIEWSHNLLTESERILLRRLSVFAGGWTLEAAEQICSDDQLLKREDVLDLLLHLVDRSLVTTEIKEENARYHFLDTIRHFAQKKLNEASETTQFHNQHLKYFSNWTNLSEGMLDKIQPLKFRKIIEVEHNNIRAALEWGLQETAQHEGAARLVVSIGAIWLRHSHFKEALQWVEKYIPLVEQEENTQANLFYLGQALSYWRDNLEQALLYGEKAEKIARAKRDNKMLIKILYYFGDIYREKKDLNRSYTALAECVVLCRETGMMSYLSMSLTSTGVILYQQGRKEASMQVIEEALQIATSENNPWGHSYALRIKADNLRFDGQFAHAFSAFKKALEVSRSIDDRISTGMELANLSLLANVLEDYAASNEYAKAALAVFQAIGNEYQQPFPLRMMAYASMHEGDLSLARTLCIDSLKGNYKLGHTTGVLACLICLAHIEWTGEHADLAVLISNIIKREAAKAPFVLLESDAKAYKILNEIINENTETHISLEDLLIELGIK